MNPGEWTDELQAILELLGLIIVVISLVALARSNSRLGASVRMNTLQAMITEMNALRRERANDPDLEREMFADRREWSDHKIKRHIAAVQLANIFEWAYLARRENLLDKDVWESWVLTWRGVILASEPLRESFVPAVWTFGRDPDVQRALESLVSNEGDIADPLDSQPTTWLSRALRKATGI